MNSIEQKSNNFIVRRPLLAYFVLSYAFFWGFLVLIIAILGILRLQSGKTPNSLIPIVITHFSFNASLNLVDTRGLGFGSTLSLWATMSGIYLVTAILVWSARGWSAQKAQGV